MKARPVKLGTDGYVECPIAEATDVQIHIPSPAGLQTLPFILKGSRKDTGCWTWNGDTEKPTLRPSIKVQSGHFAGANSCWCEYYRQHPDETPFFTCYQCHTWINDGKAQFLDDCSHEFRGQTLDLLDV
jgi:hypothetical protein